MTMPSDPFLWVAVMQRRRTRAKAFAMAGLLAWVVALALVAGR